MIDTRTAIGYMIADLQNISINPTKRVGNKVYNIRCPFCGDSQKNPMHEHFYIKIQPDERTGMALFSYDCKLCNARKRVMSLTDAINIGIKNQYLLEYIKNNQSKVKNVVYNTNSNALAEKLEFNSNTVSNVEDFKQRYMYNRLHNSDIANNPNKYKIIYDLVDFFKRNKLEPNFTDYPNAKQLLRQMHDNCIGFLSFDNTHIIFRDVTGNVGRRYTQYMIYSENKLLNMGLNTETSGIYVIPTDIDVMAKQLKLVMAEGTFDILRAYNDLYTDKTNTIFASVSNAHGYSSALKKFMEYGFMFSNIDIYSDSDVDIWYYKNNIKVYEPCANFKIYYNELYKDIGDVNKPIKLKRISI